MDNLNDIKAIWHSAKTDSLPAADEMLRVVKGYRDKTIFKKKVLIASAIFMIGMMVFTMFYYPSKMWSTRVGEVLILISGIILASTNIRSIGRFYNLQPVSNREFMAFLEKTRQNQIRFRTKTQVNAMAFCVVGMAFYLFELFSGSLVWCIVGYSAAVVYFAIMWFVVRPRNYKKHAAKLDALMARTEALLKQLDNEENEE